MSIVYRSLVLLTPFTLLVFCRTTMGRDPLMMVRSYNQIQWTERLKSFSDMEVKGSLLLVDV